MALTPFRWRLVVSDLDGTMLDRQQTISDENIAAADRLARAGIGLTIATGRIDQMAALYARQLSVKLPVISSNGALIRDPSGQTIARHVLPRDQADSLVAWLLDREYEFIVYSEETAYYQTKTHLLHYYLDYNRQARQHGLPEIRLAPVHQLLSGTPLIKMVVHAAAADKSAAFLEQIAGLNGCAAVRSTDHSFDITPAGVSKGSAVRELALSLGIDLDDVVVLGDHQNDIPMLQIAGLPIAMGNATATVRQLSRQTTTDHHEHGFAYAVDHFILR
ncbi:MAG: HAD family hydrolase [Clostridia bacterium]|nr:HAD family hydrolase [Clostridia bacterium]